MKKKTYKKRSDEMKKDTSSQVSASAEELIAPCGMNCAVCSGYLALQNDVKSKGLGIPYCQGCRPRNKKCAFLKKRCGLLLNQKIHFCYECKKFPCENLKGLEKRYMTLFRTSFIKNLETIKNKGIEQLLKDQLKQWQCPSCGKMICCHNGLCFHCNYEQLKKKKKLQWQRKKNLLRKRKLKRQKQKKKLNQRKLKRKKRNPGRKRKLRNLNLKLNNREGAING